MVNSYRQQIIVELDHPRSVADAAKRKKSRLRMKISINQLRFLNNLPFRWNELYSNRKL